jgi:hypothetical protein
MATRLQFLTKVVTYHPRLETRRAFFIVTRGIYHFFV